MNVSAKFVTHKKNNSLLNLSVDSGTIVITISLHRNLKENSSTISTKPTRVQSTLLNWRYKPTSSGFIY